MKMDQKCELASELVDYIWYCVINKNKVMFNDHSYTDKNGDIKYIDEVQDIFNAILDIVDHQLK